MGVSQSQSIPQSTPSNGNANIQMSLKNIRSIILTMLAHCEVPYAVKPYDQFLHDRCVAVCEERGYPIGSNGDPRSNGVHFIEPSLLPTLPTGVYIASATYGYLEADMPRLIYIALFTAFAAYLDDFFKQDVESVTLFSSRLTRGERQGHPMLDGLADLLNRTDTIFGHTAANMIVQDTLGYLNSLLLDYKMQGLMWSKDAQAFPNYMRHMSGAPIVYAMFIFPQDMPLTTYIQSIPELCDYICGMNDVLSFYKEEIRGEDDNYISLVSGSQRLPKYEVFKKLAADVANSTSKIDKILVGDSAALHVWSEFKAGYIYFHTSLNARYKLDQLSLGEK